MDALRAAESVESVATSSAEGARLFYWILKSIVLGPVLRAVFRPWVRGQEHLPEHGPAILVSNHLSFSDSFFLPLVVPRRVTFLAKSDYFNGRGLKGRLTAGFFRSAGQVPVDRAGGSAGEAALATGLKVLAAGDLLGVYPEGTRSPDGRLYRGKTGVARMALVGNVPVIPVVMVGTDKVQPIGQKVPNIERVGVVFGAPLDFSRYEGMESDRLVLRSITDEIMYELMRLSEQEYVDEYAATVKEQLAEAMRERIAHARARAQAAAATAAGRAADARARVEAAKADAAAARVRRSVDLSEFPEDDPGYDAEVDDRTVESSPLESLADSLGDALPDAAPDPAPGPVPRPVDDEGDATSDDLAAT